MGAGRPSEYDLKMCEEICEQVANGFNIKTVLKSEVKYPDFSTWCRWKRNNEELRNLYVNAQQDKAESEIEEIDHIRDELKAGNIEPAAANVLIQTGKWLTSKYYPKMYGDKIDHTTNGKDITPKENPLSPEQAQAILNKLDNL